ncbi:hypothetical protein [Gemmatimonas sp.]|uniref:hypothetical protein n=1 Tax=Gemmatimonas sp. TaxID=1962908 RepID=UPI0027BA63C6|nr:hypothetical protein [Gemmatimonas sp.]
MGSTPADGFPAQPESAVPASSVLANRPSIRRVPGARRMVRKLLITMSPTERLA